MLNSDRLHLRALELDDADFMYDVENDTFAWKYSDTIAPISRKILRDYALTYNADPFAAGQLRLIISDNNSDAPVGIVDLYEVSHRHLRAFIGIYICNNFRNNGFATETLNLIEDYARNNLHLHQLGAKVEAGNSIAENLFVNCGYQLSGVLKDWLGSANGKFKDMKIFTKMLRSD